MACWFNKEITLVFDNKMLEKHWKLCRKVTQFSVSVVEGRRWWCSLLNTIALLQLLQKQQNCLHCSGGLFSLVDWFVGVLCVVFSPVFSFTAKNKRKHEACFSCLLRITGPLLLHIKIYIIVSPPIYIAANHTCECLASEELPHTRAELDPCRWDLWHLEL